MYTVFKLFPSYYNIYHQGQDDLQYNQCAARALFCTFVVVNICNKNHVLCIPFGAHLVVGPFLYTVQYISCTLDFIYATFIVQYISCPVHFLSSTFPVQHISCPVHFLSRTFGVC